MSNQPCTTRQELSATQAELEIAHEEIKRLQQTLSTVLSDNRLLYKACQNAAHQIEKHCLGIRTYSIQSIGDELDRTIGNVKHKPVGAKSA